MSEPVTRIREIESLTDLQHVEGYVWCDKHGCGHEDSLNPYGDSDYCKQTDHRDLYMEKDYSMPTQKQPRTPPKPWVPTHASIKDGSLVRLVEEGPGFTIENEDGERWVDAAHWWRPLSETGPLPVEPGRLLLSISPPMSVSLFTAMLETFASEYPDACVKNGADGRYEVWSR